MRKTGDRNAEEVHDHAAGHEERREYAEHVDASALDLLAALRFGEALRDADDEANGRERIDDRQQRADRAHDVQQPLFDRAHCAPLP